MPPKNRPVVNETEARQGYLDRPVLVVLTVGIALVVIGFLFAYFGVF